MLILSSALASLTTAGAFPSGANTSTKTGLLNEALERVLESGRFLGTEQMISISVNSSGILTLPRHFVAIKANTVDGYATDLASKWWKFLSGTDTACQVYQSVVQDQGHGFCTFSDPMLDDINTYVYLQFTAIGETGDVLVQGTDENGDTIYAADGSLGATLTFNEGWSEQAFTSITSIQMPVTDSEKVLTVRYTDASTEVIGRYEPSLDVPDFRRYFVPAATLKNDDDLDSTTVVALCQRRFVPLVNDSDVVFPSHLGAIKNAILSVHYEGEADLERSEFHMGRAISLLNAQLKRATPESERGRIRINYQGGGMPQRALY